MIAEGADLPFKAVDEDMIDGALRPDLDMLHHALGSVRKLGFVGWVWREVWREVVG